MPLSLERLQARFSESLVDGHVAPELCAALAGGRERSRARMALYRRNLLGAWTQALRVAYPVVHALIGPECFAELAGAYGDAHPSTSGDLSGFGSRLADFVAAHPPTAMLAYLGDVAALEWAVHRARHAADAAGLQRERIAALSASELLSSRFVVHPACSWIASAYPVCSIWLAHQPGAAATLPSIEHAAEYGLVTRCRWNVAVARIGRAEIVALDALRAGADMEGTIAAALHADQDFDFGKALVRWLDGCAFSGIEAVQRP